MCYSTMFKVKLLIHKKRQFLDVNFWSWTYYTN